MAALLPHTTLTYSADAKVVMADDQPTNNTALRAKILQCVGGSAIQAEAFKALNAEERRELVKANRVLYVYHNRIDAVGENTPLVYESFASDGVFADGEIWEFVIQEYSNSSAGGPERFDSLGVAGASAGYPPSTGSIIVVPEPAWGFVPMAGIAALGAVWARRRARQ